MILQALNDYYKRATDAGGSEIAPVGWIRKPIDFVVVIDPHGHPVAVQCRQIFEKGKRKPGKAELLPNIGKQAQKHTNSGTDANLLWDNAAFALGYGKDGQKKLTSFLGTISSWLSEHNDAVQALTSFLRAQLQSRDTLEKTITSAEDLEALRSGSPLVTFALTTDEGQLICHRNDVRQKYQEPQESKVSCSRGICLVTGNRNIEISENETVIKGVWKAQSSGANIVSFNKPSFESYGKRDRGGENAPISSEASFAYTTALNHLLRSGSRNRFQVGDASTVCWAEQQGEAVSEYDTLLADIFGHHDDPDAGVKAVTTLFDSVQSGRFDGTEGAARYFVLGLSPNAARISVRFFHTMTLAELAPRILQHFEDIRIVHPDSASSLLTVKRLLQSLCLKTKAQPNGDIDRLPSNVAGALIDAILTDRNAPYPYQLLNLPSCAAAPSGR